VNKYVIDYEYGLADFYTEATDAKRVELEFRTAASCCFGIRKSLGDYKLLKTYSDVALPIPYRDRDATHFLSHNRDEILFRRLGDEVTDRDLSWWKLHDEHDDWCSCKEMGSPELTCSVHHFYVPEHDQKCDCLRR